MSRQLGVSPKVIASAVTGLIVWALTKFAISVDPIIEQAINVALMIVAGYLAPPGEVEPGLVGEPSDAGLSPEVSAHLNREDGQVDLSAVLVLVVLVLLVVFLIERV
jgi:hypothetical protein